jgi:hypothetical protein
MAGPAPIPVAPSEGHLPSPSTQNDGGAPASPALGSVEVSGTTSTGYRLSGGPGVSVAKAGGDVQISTNGATIPAGTVPASALVPGATDTAFVTDHAGATVKTALITNNNVDPNAAIAQSKLAISPTVAMAALNVDWSAGSVFSKTLAGGANAITFSNTTDGQTVVVSLTGVGGSTVSWPAGTKWAGGVAPTQTAAGTDVYTFVDVGGTIFGSAVQNLS